METGINHYFAQDDYSSRPTVDMANCREIGGLDENSCDMSMLFDFEEDIKKTQKCNEDQDSMPRWMLSPFQAQTSEGGFERAEEGSTGCSWTEGQGESYASVNSSPRCCRCDTPDRHVILGYGDSGELVKPLGFDDNENESVESTPGFTGSAGNDHYLFNIATTAKRIYDQQQQQIYQQQKEIFQQYQEIFQQQQQILHMNEIIMTLCERVSQLERRQEVSNVFSWTETYIQFQLQPSCVWRNKIEACMMIDD